MIDLTLSYSNPCHTPFHQGLYPPYKPVSFRHFWVTKYGIIFCETTRKKLNLSLRKDRYSQFILEEFNFHFFMIKKLNDRTRLMSEISYKLSNTINYIYTRLLSDPLPVIKLSYQCYNAELNIIGEVQVENCQIFPLFSFWAPHFVVVNGH